MHATLPPPTSIGRVWGRLRDGARNLVRKPPGIPNLARWRSALDMAISPGRPQRQSTRVRILFGSILFALGQEHLGIQVAAEYT
jgi:hypothetical protein